MISLLYHTFYKIQVSHALDPLTIHFCGINCNTAVTALIWSLVLTLPHLHSETFSPQLTPYYFTMWRNVLHGFIKYKYILKYIIEDWLFSLEGWVGIQMDPERLGTLGQVYVMWHQGGDYPSHLVYMPQCSRQKSPTSACARDCIERYYTREQIYICSDSQAALWALEATRITSKLVWEYWQAICTLSNGNKKTFLWVPGHSGIQGNKDADVLVRKASGNSFLSPEPIILISRCVGRLKIKVQLVRKHSKYWVKTPGMR
jgi:hypothetical protein